MQNLVTLLEELKTRQFKITIDKNGKSKLQQTQRNGLKAELLKPLVKISVSFLIPLLNLQDTLPSLTTITILVLARMKQG